MWCDEFPPDTSWTILWRGYIICGHCSGIRRLESSCPACGSPSLSIEMQTIRDENGRDFQVAAAFNGAEGRYEDWVYLKMLEREWKRSVIDADCFMEMAADKRPSPRAAIVLLFWSYFETRIERLLRAGMRGTPAALVEDTLRRHSFIGARLDRLYRVIFGATYSADLVDLGYSDVWKHLSEVQRRRNAFTHGQPQAIDDTLVATVVGALKIEHEAWIAVFNRRGVRPYHTQTNA